MFMAAKFLRIIRVTKNNTDNLQNLPLRHSKRRFLHGIFVEICTNSNKLILYGFGLITRYRCSNIHNTFSKPAICLPLIRLLADSGSSGAANHTKMTFLMTAYPTFGHFRHKLYIEWSLHVKTCWDGIQNRG